AGSAGRSHTERVLFHHGTGPRGRLRIHFEGPVFRDGLVSALLPSEMPRTEWAAAIFPGLTLRRRRDLCARRAGLVIGGHATPQSRRQQQHQDGPPSSNPAHLPPLSRGPTGSLRLDPSLELERQASEHAAARDDAGILKIRLLIPEMPVR